MGFQKPYKYVSDYPELMAEWDWKKNKALGLNPYKITYASAKRAWWKCSKCKHEWKTPIYSRTRKTPHGCPECYARKHTIKTVPEVYPHLLAEWDFIKNRMVLPQNVGCESRKKIWWKCSFCHCEWQETIRHRANHNSHLTPHLGCENCRKLNKNIKKEGK